ncbi:MAG: mechanosensitive ion channel family protein [Candidatus Nanopelagicales bacterium]
MIGLATETTTATTWQDLLAAQVTIATIVGAASAIHFLGSRAIRRAVRQWIETGKQRARDLPAAPEETVELQEMIMAQRREQRAVALGQLLRNLLIVMIWGTAALLILTQLGVDIGPIMASAGVAGVALGFGAQTLIKDYLSGFFLIIEDQYGVGDMVDVGVGGVIGNVEEVTLRVTRLRDLTGVVWYVRNGEILRVANQSQGWTMAVAVIPVAYDADLEEVRKIVAEIGNEMYNDPDSQAKMLGKPQFSGVDAVSGDAVFVRVVAKARPAQQISLTRDLRERLKNGLDEHGIRVPVLARPQQIGADGQPLPPGSPPPTAAL